jgi:hypothetical protein
VIFNQFLFTDLHPKFIKNEPSNVFECFLRLFAITESELSKLSGGILPGNEQPPQIESAAAD